MNDIIIEQMPYFKRAYKKMHKQDRQKVKEAIKKIIDNPQIGQEKKDDLTGTYVYKFKIHSKQMLLAYEWDPKRRVLLAIGVHENFYRDPKKHI